MQKQLVVYGVKGSGEVQQTKSRHLIFVSRKQKIVVHFGYHSLGAVEPTVCGLHRWHHAGAVKKLFSRRCTTLSRSLERNGKFVTGQ